MSGYRVLQGDCREVLRTLGPESVQCVVTSPPYFNLRDYGGSDAEIGIEQTPKEYVKNLVAVFREVRRVLRDDGVCWVVLGDSYASAWPCSRRNVIGNGSLPDGKRASRPSRLDSSLKEKDLMGVPWMAAFALRDDGWYLRQEVIWSKTAPMPESVQDRTTRSHETVFMLTKQSRYFYDATAIAEPSVGGSGGGWSKSYAEAQPSHGAMRLERPQDGGTRNRRSVWTISPAPYAEAHFATFPPKLIEPMILAGCPVGGTVLDPFAGSGTTAAVALKHGRSSISIELNPQYVELIHKRLRGVTPALPWEEAI